MTEQFCTADTTRLALVGETHHQPAEVDAVDTSARLKQRLLGKYAEKAPDCFLQFDATENIPPGELTELDDEGDLIFLNETFELTRSSFVRLLILRGPVGYPEDAPTASARKASVLRLLDKIRAQIVAEDDGTFRALTEAEVTKKAERFALTGVPGYHRW